MAAIGYDADNQIEIYDDEIEAAIACACDKFQIDDLTKASQKKWKRVCKYIGDTVFKDKKILKSNVLNIYNNNIIPTNNNAYDYDVLNVLCDYFNSLCDEYDKLMSAEAFSLFLGMSRESVSLWGQDEPSSARFNIYKKIKNGRLESILDAAADNGNVTGTMFVGNVEYGLNLPGATREVVHRQEISVQEALKIDKNSE